MKFSLNDYGIGYLKTFDNKPFFVILSSESIEFAGVSLLDTKSITITKSYENQWFGQYANEQHKREQAFSVWEYFV